MSIASHPRNLLRCICVARKTNTRVLRLANHALFRTSCSPKREYSGVPPIQDHSHSINALPLEDVDKQASTIPWYIRTQPLQTPLSESLDKRHDLPVLPQNPPPILTDLLQHLSAELGIEHISMLDLRAIDPPPAFGAGLLMIFGTARSEKHLHVSADKLCRWLRAEYGLRPYADGLLGRNELKLKLKRKARRSRILNTSGSTATEESDDGIRTGWICIEVGRVADGDTQMAANDNETATTFVGFDASSHSAKIVVQMMTEQKREETDLESLWVKIKDRQQTWAGSIETHS